MSVGRMAPVGRARDFPGFKGDFHFDSPIELAENRDHAV